MIGWYSFRASVLLLVCSLSPVLCGCAPKIGDAPPADPPPDQISSAEATPGTPSIPVYAESPSLPEGDAEVRIRAVILQHSAAVKSISSYRMDVAWEERHFPETALDQPLPKGIVSSSGEGTLLWQDGKWRVEHRNRMDRIDAMRGQILQHEGLQLKAQAVPEKYDTWVVYNGEYFARRNSHFGHTLYAYSRERIDYQAYLFPNPLEFGFEIAPRNGSFDATYATSQLPTHKPVTHWALDSLESVEGGRKIRISRNVDLKPGTWETQYLIDPERDFLAVGLDSWYPPDGRTDEYRLQLQQLSDGRWFPKEAHYRRRDSYRTWVFSDVSVNAAIDPMLFDMESIPFEKERARLIKQDANGIQKVYIFRDGQWEPESQVPKHLRPAQK